MREKRAIPSPRTCMLNARSLELSTDYMQSDFEYVKSVVELNGEGLKHACYKLRNNKEIVTAAVKNNFAALRHASEDLTSSYDFCLKMCNIDYRSVEHAHPFLRDDEDFMLTALEANGGVVRFFSERLRSDKEVMRQALDMCPHNEMLANCDERLRGDRAFVLEIVLMNGLSLQHASKELRRDPEIVHTAVGENGLALAYASSQCRADRQIVLRAVAQNGGALAYAAEELKRDRAIMLLASRGGAAGHVAGMLNRQARCASSPGNRRAQQPLPPPMKKMLTQRPHTATGVSKTASGSLPRPHSSTGARPSIRSEVSSESGASRTSRTSSNARGSMKRSSSSPAVYNHPSQDPLAQRQTQRMPVTAGLAATPSRPLTATRTTRALARTNTGSIERFALSKMAGRESVSNDDDSDGGPHVTFASVPSVRNVPRESLGSESMMLRPSIYEDHGLESMPLLPWQQAEEEANERVAEYNERVFHARDERQAAKGMNVHSKGGALTFNKVASDDSGQAGGMMVHTNTLLRPHEGTKKPGKQRKGVTVWSKPEEQIYIEDEGSGSDAGPAMTRTKSRATMVVEDSTKHVLGKWAGDPAWKPRPARALTRTLSAGGLSADDRVIKKVGSKKVKQTKSEMTQSLKDVLDTEKQVAFEKQKSMKAGDIHKEKVLLKAMRFGHNLSLPSSLRSSLKRLSVTR